MEAQDAIDKIESLKIDLEREIPIMILAMGMNLRADVTARITGKGVDKDGSQYPYPYSPAYQKLKDKKGYEVGHRNFIGVGKSRGQLIQNYSVFKKDGIVYLGFENEQEKKVAEGNSFGNGKWSGVGTNIIEPSESEIEARVKEFETKLETFLKNYL